MTMQSALNAQPDLDQYFDTHPEPRLDPGLIQRALQDGYSRPFLLIDPEIIRGDCQHKQQEPPCGDGRFEKD